MYATVIDMTDRYGTELIVRLSNPQDRTVTIVAPAPVNTAIADATALVNSYIRGRYQVPIGTPPADIVRATCVLAVYDLATSEKTSPTEEMRNARTDTIAWLEGISRGLINLDVPAAGGATDGSGARAGDRGRVFTDKSLAGM